MQSPDSSDSTCLYSAHLRSEPHHRSPNLIASNPECHFSTPCLAYADHLHCNHYAPTYETDLPHILSEKRHHFAAEYVIASSTVSWKEKTSTHRMKDESYLSSNEAAVLGQLRNQKPSASSERPPHWIWVEEEEGKTNLAPVRSERFTSQVTPLQEKFIWENVSSPFISEEVRMLRKIRFE